MSFSTSGGRNLTILGVGALLITILTTTASLLIYRNSGDIYLDRSRPGYLPDEDEVKEEPVTNNSFSYPDVGPLNKAELEQYLKELRAINARLEALSDPYAPGPLSDESLGIAEPPKDPEEAKNK